MRHDVQPVILAESLCLDPLVWGQGHGTVGGAALDLGIPGDLLGPPRRDKDPDLLMCFKSPEILITTSGLRTIFVPFSPRKEETTRAANLPTAASQAFDSHAHPMSSYPKLVRSR